MSDQIEKTLEHIQEQLYLIQLQQGLQERVLGCLLRGLARHPDLLDDVENEFHALADAMKQTNPELLDVVLPYIERLTKRE
ncbi:hypothetical protein BKK49_09040 [Rodentibacter rarus]|uniref:hypothetical protein n=1 Tax=Rodentibacter rarus TaxID=1908260 RepID=UPI0009C4F7F0|nr:hypothetical protein [Rodentibacter rarus]OOF38838.1 hypothetical protein BKK49_09040 [Rodentibacter rarus]